MSNTNQGPIGSTSTEDQIGLDKPRMFKVLLHNDDYTPMDFVIDLLMQVFGKGEMAAMQIMLNVHNLGKGVCGVYTYEIAETKIAKVQEMAEQHQYPLKASMEEE